MTAANFKNVFVILFSCIALMLLFLILEALLPREVISLQLLHLAMVVCLGIALFMAIFAVRHSHRIQQAGHNRAMEGMQREVDKTVRRYTSLLEGAGNAIFVFDAETGILEEVNRKGMEMLGFTKEEMLAMRGKDLFPADEQHRFLSMVFRVRRRGRAHADNLPFLRKDGSRLLGEVEARLIDLGDERLVHAIVRDITFRHHYLREMRQRNSELTILNNILTTTSSTQNPDRVLEATLTETLERFGADAGTIHVVNEDGDQLRLKVCRNVSPQLADELSRCPVGSDEECRMAASQRCHVLNDPEPACLFAGRAYAEGWHCITAVPLIVNGNLTGIMHIMTREENRYTREDLLFLSTIGSQAALGVEQTRLFCELNRKNEELLRSHNALEQSSHRLSVYQGTLKRNLALVEQANLEMKQLDRMKSSFLGMISHEFNTPLTSIMGGAELLINRQGTLEPEEERQILEMVRSGGARLYEIVTDLLKAARLKAKADAVNRIPLQLASVMEFLHDQLRPFLEERRQQVAFDGLEFLPYFSGDRDYLEEVMCELLMNAMKFTPDGGEIIVSGRVVGPGDLQQKEGLLSRFNKGFCDNIANACYLEIEVRDRGIGIEEAEHLRIFEIFYEVGEIRHHSSSKHRFQGKGAGLGLAIVKGMVEAHGGMVWVESPAAGREGEKGTSFFLLLPLEETADQPELPFMRDPAP